MIFAESSARRLLMVVSEVIHHLMPLKKKKCFFKKYVWWQGIFLSRLTEKQVFPAESRAKNWTDFGGEPQPLQVSHFTNTAFLLFHVFLSSFLSKHVFTSCPQNEDGEKEWMKQMQGGVGWVGLKIGTWRRRERINHPVRRTTPPDWKNSRGFSLSLSPSFPLFLS